MSLADDISTQVQQILSVSWDERDGKTVPETENVALAGGAVELEATMLYADLADSTELAIHDRKMAARLFKAFLAVSTRLIRNAGGGVRSFDGDRVMGVFVEGNKNTNAVKCALQINWAFSQVIKPKFQASYTVLRDGTLKLGHCTGIDTSRVRVVRAGIRNNNDLVWVGKAPNIAAKLSTIRESPYHSFITGNVYDAMTDTSKLGGTEYKNMWEERAWKAQGLDRIFRSSWTWKPD